ncbi:hypothetical protein P3X46_007191 [Hevea brasiliensis]|uniref:Era-type G domain-containing protein n=2 Tax=Hevea brasiliensis TaxID=3981 RepID=A0ABQ9MWF0_HEVBR|nr:hypothetical protein P3X46_007191 [Hevea brasiliensis]
MKAFRTLRTLNIFASKPQNSNSHLFNRILLSHFFSAQPEQNQSENDNNDSFFDSSRYAVTNIDTNTTALEPTWDEKYRQRADRLVFGHETQKSKVKLLQEQEEEEKRRVLAKALLQAALERPDEEDDDEVVREEDQKSLSVGIVGAPNAGKSALTNHMVGTKVSAVSRKTNTTIHEVLGVMTKGDTQICFFDTPGIMLKKNGYPYKDMKARVENAWCAVDLYDMIMVVFDVHRHLTRPDSRVVRLIERVGAQTNPKQKRVLCMNKIDLVEKKKDLLKVSEQFKDLPGYDRCFMISGLKGVGVKDLTQYLMEQALKRPWDEDPLHMSEEVMKNISLEVVRERLLDHVHQEIPYGIEHRLIDWKELKDGSLRIEQHFITHKLSQRKILVGKKGSKIGRIGIEANEELRSIYKREVHLILQVRLK